MDQPDVITRLNADLEGRYRIERELGSGGMATVYLADDLRHERKVAVKVLKPGLTELVASERFQAEIRTTANLQHPHILPLFDSGRADGALFFVMPYVDGESLADRLAREQRLPVSEALRIAALIAGALEYAHQRGIVHRDVKPANVMLSGDLPMLADFGIALAARQAQDVRLTQADTSLGTVLYGSPEQMSGEGTVDGRSDQYSLACVLYELLAGEPPHMAPTGMAVLARRLTAPAPSIRSLRDDVPEAVEGALATALEVSPDARFPSMAAFLAALGDPRDSTPLRRAGNLPAQATSLVGRDGALDEVVSLLDSARMVTLLGTGGMGKTRLAIEVADLTSADYPDGTWFVDLAAVAEARAVGHAAAGVFGVTQQSGKTVEESLVDALGGRRLLLVLDNCEHVTAAAAGLAHAILAGCHEVKIVATSREALSVTGEHVWPVPALEVTGADAPAAALFAERAQAVAPGFRIGDDGPVILEICRKLDGIPLAIELAAARVRSLGPRQILERLDERFRLLTSGPREPDRKRHQTLRHAVQWSYDLLTDRERTVLERAAVFSGGFSLEAAEHVCATDGIDDFEVVDLLDSLVSKSLVQVDRSGGAMRYGILETIRSFGAEKLREAGREEEARRHHAAFFALESDHNFEIWRSPREREAYEWLDREIHNLRDAFRWALAHDEVDIAARIASDVGDVGRFRLREEAATWAEEVVDRAREVRHPRLAVLLTWSASSAWAFSRFEDAQRFGEEALAIQDDPHFDPFVWAYGDLAFVAMLTGDVARGIEWIRAGANHPADRLDRFMLSFHLYLLATTGHVDEARGMADAVVEKVDAAGVPMSIAVAYGGKGAALEASDPDAALAAYEHSLEVSRAAGCRFMEMLVAPRVAALHARSGEPRAALQGFERMLVTFGEATDVATVSAWRASLVVLLEKLAHHEAAATLHGTFADVIDVTGVVPEHAGAVERLQTTMRSEGFRAAAARGKEMSLREASNYAIEQVRASLTALEETSPA